MEKLLNKLNESLYNLLVFMILASASIISPTAV